jgi:hypothetical protein
MSFAELKQEVTGMTRKQRRELFELLSEISRNDEKFWAREITSRMARMDAGEKYTLEDFRRRHDELAAQGL